jgi:hypothetical protein
MRTKCRRRVLLAQWGRCWQSVGTVIIAETRETAERRTLNEKGMVNKPAPSVFWAMVNMVALRDAVPRLAG